MLNWVRRLFKIGKVYDFRILKVVKNPDSVPGAYVVAVSDTPWDDRSWSYIKDINATAKLLPGLPLMEYTGYLDQAFLFNFRSTAEEYAHLAVADMEQIDRVTLDENSL